MKKEDLFKLDSYELKFGNGATITDKKSGEVTYTGFCAVRILDLEQKVTKKLVENVMATADTQEKAHDAALEKACELLGAK